MRIFTLGKNGIPLFFFAFILFSGTSSYGQTCPTVDDPIQTFCDTELPTIGDLQATGTDVAWYEDETSTTPLSPETSLTDGEDYFAGSETDTTCPRGSVTVTIYGAPTILDVNKMPETKQSAGAYILCLETGGDPIYLSDVQTDVPVAWYANDLTKDGANEEPLDAATTEVSVGDYYAAREPSDVGGCATSRARLTVIQPTAPGAQAAQTFCEANDPVVGDIAAQGNNKYYETPDDFYALDPNTPMIDGQTYYVSRAELCESEDRTAVTVTIDPPQVNQEVQEFCESIGTGNEYSVPTVAHLEPTDVQWYASEEFTTALAPEEELQDGAFYYTPISDCEYTRVEAKFLHTPNAGATTNDLEFCSTEAPVNLVDYIDESILGAPDRDGTFSPALENNMFDPSQWEVGIDHSFEYTVEATYNAAGEELCPADMARITLRVVEGPNAGDAADIPVCYIDAGTQESFNETITANLGDREQGGAFNPSLENIYTEISQAGNVSGSYNTTYTVTDTVTGCEDSAELTITLGAAPNAGATTDLKFCASDAPVDLVDLIQPSDALGAPDAGGTITPELQSGGTVFDPAVDAAGEYTYTVESSDGICEADDTRINITLTPLADAGEDDTFFFCDVDGPQSIYDLLAENGVTTEGTFDDDVNLDNGVFNPSQYGVGELSVNYTVQPTDSCGDPDTATYTLVVSATPGAPAATGITACASEFLTIGDLEVQADAGNIVVWYTDESLTEIAAETDLLISGDYYVTQTNEAGCESPATMITNVINDAPTPTIAEGGAIFCSYDRPTIAELEDNMADTGITWYDAETGGNVLASTTQLQNGTTYYASLTDAASGCETSQRLAVTPDLQTCPLPIPDAFSPNGDGINDFFDIRFAEQEYPNYSVEIFNRWGSKVFTGNASNLWDGSSESGSDQELPAGVYFYILNFNDGQTGPVQGRVYLSR